MVFQLAVNAEEQKGQAHMKMRTRTITAVLALAAALTTIQGVSMFNTASPRTAVVTTAEAPSCFACVCAVAGAKCE
jgi:preprotein translocase subunit SecY